MLVRTQLRARPPHNADGTHTEGASGASRVVTVEADPLGGSDRCADGTLADAIMAERRHPGQGCRSCLGILRLAKKYGPERLDDAAGPSRCRISCGVRFCARRPSEGLWAVAQARATSPKLPTGRPSPRAVAQALAPVAQVPHPSPKFPSVESPRSAPSRPSRVAADAIAASAWSGGARDERPGSPCCASASAPRTFRVLGVDSPSSSRRGTCASSARALGGRSRCASSRR
jgi:hypothetical protein